MISYAITDPSTLDFNHLERDLKRFSQKASMIVYRDKSNVSQHEAAFVQAAKMYDFEKVIIHGNPSLAKAAGADGVHLSSLQLDEIAEAKAMGLFVVVSTHTIEELKKAEVLGADMATFSPIFETPNKGAPVGLEVLRSVTSQVHIPVLALGGILTEEQIRACERYGASGFASIRYFGA
ncbi:thiamine phosphate synthase [Sulfurovum sp. XTW-4]|uniref:Thiamine phosphate synthase n=1 Tax=Sulfurovum xiamenensis TaxID=3019066 RepID=A0ABT7QPV7_9BACT|nr:thiamine phosphate synthase [Sulfurovum xiamenensis]MDM5262609.1 thiamine phosphate synthase [Sulfurovum xiamenensis]